MIVSFSFMRSRLVSHRLLTAEALIRSHGSPYGVCGGESDIGGSLEYYASPLSANITNAPHAHSRLYHRRNAVSRRTASLNRPQKTRYQSVSSQVVLCLAVFA